MRTFRSFFFFVVSRTRRSSGGCGFFLVVFVGGLGVVVFRRDLFLVFVVGFGFVWWLRFVSEREVGLRVVGT